MDDPLRRLLDRKPLDPALGMRGPNPPMEPLREVQGTSGGNGSFQLPRQEDPVSNPVAAAPLSPVQDKGTPGVIVSINGTLFTATVVLSDLAPL